MSQIKQIAVSIQHRALLEFVGVGCNGKVKYISILQTKNNKKQSEEKEGGVGCGWTMENNQNEQNVAGNHRTKMESIRLSSIRTASLQTDCRTNTKRKQRK